HEKRRSPMTFRKLRPILLSAFLAAPVLAAPATQPAPAPSPEQQQEIQRLILQLGDNDFKAREEATKKLQSIGKPALVQLQEALKLDDPEIQTRAETLIKKLNQRTLPGGPLDNSGRVTAHSLRVSNDQGSTIVEVNDSGRQFRIRQDKDGIALTVTAVID